ncbi:MAG: hypothetical protein K2L28_03710 [Muribaculaceae bacterium]|nr:hypothetical protein [Muribaculaceae bacterium]
MIKRLTLALGIAACALGAGAQVQNYALRLEPTSSVDCGAMPQLNGLDTYTIQFWFNPDQWTQGAVLFSRGEGLKASLGAEGVLELTLGNSHVSVPSEALAAQKWSQVTVLASNGSGSVWVDGERAARASSVQLPASSEAFIIGGQGYKGRIDEIRLWKCLLSGEFDYFRNNTLNKWMPQYEDLLVYYKMDQELCKHLVDYCAIDVEDADYNNHGILQGGATKEAVTDNAGLPYILNSAYTANERFFDRYIPAEQYLLSNDIINLGISCHADGHLVYDSPCDHATLEGDARRLEEYEGRNTVLEVNGNGSMVAPVSALDTPKSYGFESFIYLEEWTDGAYLLRRENEEGTLGFAIMLGHFTKPNATEPEKVVVIRVNGQCWRYPIKLTTGAWHHLGVSYSGGNTTSTVFNLSFDGEAVPNPRTYYHDGSNDGIPQWPADALPVIGSGLKAKFDQTVIHRSGVSNQEFASHMRNGMTMVTLTTPVTASLLTNGGAYYDFDDPENPGFDLYSQDNWLRIMKSAYDGYRGARFYISVRTPAGYHDHNLINLINNAEWRKNFAEDLGRLSVPYDGVELDLEWVYNWSSYGLLAEEIRANLPEGKIFRVSTHNVTFYFPKAKMEYVDAFTFQQYGPQRTHFLYSSFESYCRQFVNYGYPREKIMTSYSTTTSNGSMGAPIMGVKDGFFGEDYVPRKEEESKTFENGETFWFTGPLQTYERAKYTREQGFKGIFYWDMGNDTYDTNPDGSRTMSKWNLARWSSYAINSNVDRLVTEVEVNHASAGVSTPVAGETETSLGVSCDGSTLHLCVPGTELTGVSVYSTTGALVLDAALSDGCVDVSFISAGCYVVSAKAADGTTYNAKFIK